MDTISITNIQQGMSNFQVNVTVCHWILGVGYWIFNYSF